MIEVLLALVLLLAALVASTSLVTTALKVGGNSRLKQVATDIASGELDSAVQSGATQLLTEMGFSGLGSVAAVSSVSEGGVNYSVEREVQPGTSACAAPQSGVPNELKVTVWVSWQAGASGTWWSGSSATNKLVQESTLVAVPATALNANDGSILVKITDDLGNPQSLVQITLTPPGTEQVDSTDAGCALFANLAPGSYTVTAYRSGWIDSNNDVSNGVPSQPSWTANVTAGNVTTVPGSAPLYYAQAAHVSENFTTSSGNLPTLAVNGNPGGSLALPLSFYNSTYLTSPYVSTSPAQVFPFRSTTPGYTVVPTSCNDANGLPDEYTNGVSNGSTADGVGLSSLTPGGNTTANFSLTPVQVAVTDSHGNQLQGASVTASASTPTGGTDSSCGSGSLAMPTLSLGATCPGGSGCAVQTAYHSSAGTEVDAILASYVHFLPRPTVLSAARHRSVPRRSNTQRNPQSRGGVTPHVPAVTSQIPNPSHSNASAGTSGALNESALPSTSRRTNTTLTSSAVRVVHGQVVTFTASVTGASAGSVGPTGTVTFEDRDGFLGTATLTNGVADYTSSTLAAGGTHSITAVYGGDQNFAASASHTLNVEVKKAASKTTLVSNLGQSTQGQAVTFTASVVAVGPGSGLPGGKVLFEDGTRTIHSSNLHDGFVVFTTSSLSDTRHNITAVYEGSADVGSSRSGELTRQVTHADTSVVLTSSANPVQPGAPVNFVATVVPVSPASGTPTGKVVFKDGNKVLDRSSLKDGIANFVTSSLVPGSTHAITAVYHGSKNFKGSSSNVLSTTVLTSVTTGDAPKATLDSWYGHFNPRSNARLLSAVATQTTISSNANPSTYGQSVTLTATVSPDDGGGSVAFYQNGSSISGCTAQTLSNVGGSYQATCTTTALSGGTDTISATYSGDTSYATSTTTSTTLADVTGHGNTGTPQGGVTIGTSGPTTLSANAISLDGSTGWVQTTNSYSGPTTFSIVAWFKSSSSSGGSIAGFTNVQGNSGQSSWDRQLWLDNSGKLVFGVYPGATDEVTSPSAYNNGQWHLAVAVLGASGQQLYVDGTKVVSNSSVTTAQSYTGYWHVGWASESSWPDAPTSSYFNGSLAEAAIVPSQLSAAQITTLYGEASTSAFATYMGGLSPTSYWPMQQGNVTQTVNKASTTISVTSSVNPSTYGQSVMFTATVSETAPGNATGTVTFKDGATTLGTGTLSNDVATYTTSSLSVATHSITAVYAGDSNFSGSTSSTLSQVVNQASSTTTLTSSANPSVYGQSVTFTATVAAVSPGSGTATGTVTFKDGATTLGTGTLSGGVATYTTSSLALGTHSVTAAYGGDTNFKSSTSSTLSQVVNQASSTTTLTSSSNPSVYGQSVTFTATVAGASPSTGTPTGTVTFKDGGTTLGTGTLSGGVATYTTSSLALGTHSVTAAYGGDTNFKSSTSSTLSQVVNQASSTTTLTSSLNPSQYNQSVTFTATVAAASPATGTPTGTVTFKDGGTTLGTGTLSGGVATYSTSTLSIGTHSITAVYGGDTNFTGSTSSVLSQVVNQISTTVTIASNGSSVFGQSVTFTSSVSPSSAQGTIGYYDNGNFVACVSTNNYVLSPNPFNCPVVGGATTTYTTSQLTTGSHTITAYFFGSTNYRVVVERPHSHMDSEPSEHDDHARFERQPELLRPVGHLHRNGRAGLARCGHTHGHRHLQGRWHHPWDRDPERRVRNIQHLLLDSGDTQHHRRLRRRHQLPNLYIEHSPTACRQRRDRRTVEPSVRDIRDSGYLQQCEPR